MGTGFSYCCEKCGEEFSVHLGAGMRFPTVYQDTMRDIIAGKYGPERRTILYNEPYAAVDIEQYVYKCSCGYWKVDKELSLYAPNNPEAIPKKQYGIKTVEEWGYVPYVTRFQLKEDYHLIKRYIHICSKCGKRMRKAQKRELEEIRCPKCDSLCRQRDYLFWD